MMFQFNEYRRRVIPCGTDEADIHVEVQFDDRPDENKIAFIEWGKVRIVTNIMLVCALSSLTGVYHRRVEIPGS